MKRSLPKFMCVFLAIVLILIEFPAFTLAASSSQAVQVTKTVSPSAILEGGEAEVQLQVTGSGDSSFVKPNDVILIIDRSGSMLPGNNNGEDKMANAKAAAKGFIDLVDFTKHRVGIVDFASDAKYTDLSSNPNQLKSYVDGIQANGGTGTRDAIIKARELLGNHRPDAQPVIILMTDGEATLPDPVATARQAALEQANVAKSENIVFYTIALLKTNENPDTSAPNQLMREMATTAHHHHFVLGSTGLAEIYEAIVDEIGVASAYDVTVTDRISSEFEIVPDSYLDNIPRPTVEGNTLTFKFNELKEQTLTLTYKIRHKVGGATGNLSVGAENINVTYKNYAGAPHQFTVPNPTINVSYPAPEIISVVKDRGLIDGGESVVVTGKNFLPNPAVSFGANAAREIQYIDSTKLIMVAPKGVQGDVAIKVTNTDGQFATATYKYIANPIITSVSPDIGPLAGGTRVVITGEYFLEGAEVTFGNQAATIISTTSKQIIVNTPPSATVQTVDVSILNPDGTNATAVQAYSYVPAPVVSSVFPDQGLTLGNENITIQGRHFINGAKVYFNNTLLSTEFISDTELSVVTPSWGKAEAVNVRVVNPDGQESSLDSGYQYVYPAPLITGISPSQGLVTGNDSVTVTGKFFQNGAKLFFDGVGLQNVVFYSSTQLKAKTPGWGTADIVDVKVINPDGQEDVLVDSFTYQLPDELKITGITPTEGPLDGGTTVSITGSNLRLVKDLYLDSAKITIKSNNGSVLTFVTPKAATPGKVDVKVVDSYGRESLMTEAFEYLSPPPPPVPTITSITPNEGAMQGGYVVVIKGTNFESTSKAFVNDILASTLFYDRTELRVTIPASEVSGPVDVKVLNVSGQEAIAARAFTYLAPPPKEPPVISSVTPNEGELKGGYNVKLLGSNFETNAKLYFNGALIGFTFYSKNEVRFSVPASETPGSVDIKIVNSDGQEATVTDGFTYLAPPAKPAPEISSVTPNEGLLQGGYTIKVLGKNIESSAKLYFDDLLVSFTFYSNSEIRVKVPVSQTPGAVDVKIVNSDGQEAILADAFTYLAPPPPPAPTITSVTPNEGYLEGGYSIAVKGTNYSNSSVIHMDDQPIQTVFYSSRELRAKVPASPVAKIVDIKVVNADDQFAIAAGAFSYIAPPPPPAPTITSLSPDSGVIAGGYSSFVNGTNFSSATKVYFNDVLLSSVYFTTQQIRVTVPANATTGPVTVKVVNSDGQEAELPNGFTYLLPPPPSITEISPNNGELDGGYNIVLKGTGFNASSVVYIDNVAAPTTFYTGSELRAKVPKGTQPGPVDVQVVNGDGQNATIAGGFTYNSPPPPPAPVITSITPNSGAMAGGYYIKIVGSNFNASTKVWINNTEVQTVYYSSKEVRGRVPVTTISGPVNVKVVNNDGQVAEVVGGFSYDAPPPKPAPTINSITPNTGPLSGGSLISIKGANFASTTKVYINGISVQTIYYSTGEVRARVPASTVSGSVDIRVENSDGQYVEVTGGYTYQ
ncbi:IPT/TIG domain-containing protein [Paenibacillus brevis]|uniref:IPT/TIG domain-containing protein n=1 Tax=Paenibacillus brevis TaxID=2841508 RepID=A0ABS6FL98_9BACL|nr:IPT/TIG domain-containing protein [Paenibacillus brevis]MBU5670958.1 IPT/TIG domain-containing protein [Paenibacillus brevis]